MKTFTILITLFISLTAFGNITKGELDKLLQAKGSSLDSFERQGSQILLGETTGGGKLVPFSKVEIIFTKDEAIFKNEIESVHLTDGRTLGGLESLRSAGKYITNEDVIAVITK